MTDWADVVSRARGLSGRLLGQKQMEALHWCRDVASLADQLALLGAIAARDPHTPAIAGDIESVLRRRAGARLRILERWAGDRAHLLAPLLEDEDRRSLRALLRGAAAGVDPELRVAGLVPTRLLPVRAIEQLARAGDVRTIAVQLLAWRHPFGPELAVETSRPRPDLFQEEMALARAFAARARAAARAGDRAMRHFVRRTIDLENLWSVLVFADRLSDVDPRTVFIEGGARITLDDLQLAARTRNRATVEAHLAPRIVDTPLAAALGPGLKPAEDATLDALVAEFRSAARRDPLGLANVVLFVLRQRVELRQLFRILWSVTLHVPPGTMAVALGVAQ